MLEITVRPSFKAFGFNALILAAADVKFGRLRAWENGVEVCGFAGPMKEKADSSSRRSSE
jgi:hypothetical protein